MIIIIGESCTDIYVYTKSTRLSPEAPVPVLIPIHKNKTGGMALNVYNNEGVVYKEPKLKVMGLEMVKSSTPSVIREKMKKVLNLMMMGTEEDVHEFVANFRDEFNKLPPEDISSPRGCNGIAQYSDSATLYKKGTPIHVKGAILYNFHLKRLVLENKYPMIKEFEKLKFS